MRHRLADDIPVRLSGRGELPSEIDLSSLSRRRAAPLYILNQNGDVVLTSVNVPTPTLPPEIDEIVRELRIRDAKSEHIFLSPTGFHIVHMTPMAGLAGEPYAAVSVTSFRRGRRPSVDLGKFGLTKREQEVVELLVRGTATSEIATSLGIAGSTVIQHIKSAMSKTGTHGRVELVLAVSGGIDVMRSNSPRPRLLTEATR